MLSDDDHHDKINTPVKQERYELIMQSDTHMQHGHISSLL